MDRPQDARTGVIRRRTISRRGFFVFAGGIESSRRVDPFAGEDRGMRPSAAVWVLQVVVIAALYYAAARLGLTWQLPGTNASPVWPPSGIGFAAVMLLGSHSWPGIAVGAFLANLSSTGFATSAGICVGNTLEQVVGVALLRRLVGSRNPLDRAGDVFRFVVSAVAGCLLASLNGTLNLWGWGIISGERCWQVWLAWWLGDLAGILILAPVIYSLFQKSDVQWTRSRWCEAIALFASLAAATQFLFGDHRGWFDFELLDSLAYAVVPGLAWAAFRFGPRETALAAALMSAIAIVHTSNGHGPFSRTDRVSAADATRVLAAPSPDAGDEQRRRAEPLLMLQIFVLAIAVTSATLAGAVSERNRSEQRLRDLNVHLEQRVADRTAELQHANAALERSNHELDDFAHIASHDLKEPLRGINTYAGFLLEDYADKLDEDGQSKLHTLQRLTRRMEALIESLLMYSRVGRTELAIQDTDLNDTLAEIVESLEIRLRELGVEIRRPQPLPVVHCDRVRVGEVFRNLITNAMKYNDKPQRWIEVGCEQRPLNGNGSELVFHVRDNGIGIREKHLDSVFRIFKRLHGRDEYGGGTGIGLTIVKKIVERHGGQIWLESTFGEGTTFYFTLAKG
jgi:signal transduction histidine kinase